MTQKLNPSLQKKSVARVAATQCLYREAMTHDVQNATTWVGALKQQLAGNRSEQRLLVGAPIEPDYKLLEAILAGTKQWQADIDKRLNTVLAADWKRERMSPLLIAILQCAIFELFFHKDAKPAIIIDEYTRLTHSFFGESDVHFIHGALATLAKQCHE